VTPLSVQTITEDSTDTMDDLLLAQMLQLEYDREHDLLVAAQEKHHNKDSKSMSRSIIKTFTTIYNCSCYFI